MNVHMLREKSNNKFKTSTEKISDVFSRDEQSVTSSNNEQSHNTTCTENKNCQAEKYDMWPKKPQRDVQSNEPVMLIQHKRLKKHMPQEDDKNCQSKEFYGLKVCADKKCQASMCYKKIDKNCQTNVIMWPVKPQMDMWSKEPAK